MLNAEVLTFQEFVTHEPLPLSRIQGAVLEFLQGRDDVVLFGAQAVNAYVAEPRATRVVDVMSTRGAELAEELREFLSDRFHIAVRVREVAGAKGLRVYQVRKEGNRRLFDIREVSELPKSEKIDNVEVLSPLQLIVSKVVSYHSRRGNPKSGTDWRDIGELVLRFPELKGSVSAELEKLERSDELLGTWNTIAEFGFESPDEDDDLNY